VVYGDVTVLLYPEDYGFVRGQVFFLKIVEELMSEQVLMAGFFLKRAFFCLLRCAWENMRRSG
jgi:hypothetical protein